MCCGNQEINRLYIKNGDNGTLNCENGVEWSKEGTPISKEDQHYEYTDVELTIIDFSDVNKGNYSCKTSGGEKVEFKVYSAANVSDFESKSKNLVEGDELELKCKANGVNEVVWSFENDTLSENGHIKFEEYNKIKNGKLKIPSLQFGDAGTYSCTAGSSTRTILVRVKDKLAALYPFLGIVGEVIVFCAIIACYERKRAKKMAEDDQPEEAGQLTNSMDNKNDEVRQRK